MVIQIVSISMHKNTLLYILELPDHGQIDRPSLKLAPPVFDDFKPSVCLALSYPSSVKLGNYIKPAVVGSQPTLNIYTNSVIPTTSFHPNTKYILVLSDPDATS